MPDAPSPIQGRVAGKVALVTGAASGIGRAAAVTLARHGSAVCCSDLNASGAEKTAAGIVSAGGTAWACPLDVTSESDWEKALEQVVRTRGQLDVVVNCAGGASGSP